MKSNDKKDNGGHKNFILRILLSVISQSSTTSSLVIFLLVEKKIDNDFQFFAIFYFLFFRKTPFASLQKAVKP